MAANQEEIKRRLHSVETIKKITKAMELVSTAKLKKIKKKLSSIENFYQSSYEMFAKIFSQANLKDLQIIKSNLFETENTQVQNKLFIVISSNIGFCGSYNSAINKMVLTNLNKKNDAVIVIGKKGLNYLKSRNVNIIDSFINFNEEISYDEAKIVTEKMLSYFYDKKNNFSHIYLVYTNFVNSLTYVPKMFQLLPISQDYIQKFNQEKNKESEEIVKSAFEPDPISVLWEIIPFYLTSVSYGALIESKVSEQAARRTSMESATKSASDLIDNLKIEFNRLRQAAITSEISEIVAGADSQ